jgi:hypothetical protein
VLEVAQVLKDQEVHRELKELKVRQEILVLRDQKVHRELKELKGQQEIQEHKGK